jgi:hypothetical protein
MKKIALDSAVIDPNHGPKSNTPEEPVRTIRTKRPFFLKKWAEKFNAFPPKKKILISVLSILGILIIGGGITYFAILKEADLSDLNLSNLISALLTRDKDFKNITHDEPDEPRSIESPLNGRLFTKSEWDNISKRYPVAVMIENHISARPQAGYNDADIVFEALAEGGITRTMPIFWSNDVESIGPIRSARQYFIEWFMPYDPLFMFIGYAEGDPDNYYREVDAGRSLWEYEIKGLNTSGSFWRVTHKASPHNAYSSTETLYNLADSLGYNEKPEDIESLEFKEDSPLEERGESTTATIQFFDRLSNNGLYDITWEYDRASNTYLRFNNSTPYTDENTGEQVYAKNVVIMRNDMTSTYDFKAHIIIDTIGEGDATVLRDGQVINCTWKKEDLYSRIHLYNTEGEEIELNRGIIWYESVPVDQGTAHIDN